MMTIVIAVLWPIVIAVLWPVVYVFMHNMEESLVAISNSTYTHSISHHHHPPATGKLAWLHTKLNN